MNRSRPMLASTLAFLIILALWAPAGGSGSLSEDQRRRLEGGEVVVLDTLPPGAIPSGSQGGTALAVVHASPESVWHLIIDYPRHSGLYPRVTTAQVLESDRGRALVRYVVEVGPFAFGFHVNNHVDTGRRRLVWRLAEGKTNSLFRENQGYWQVEPHEDGTMLTYAMAARTVLPAFLTRGAEREGLVDTVKAVRDRAERRR